ncbi:hypothetical protein Tco_0060627 [Tanacetum coccineum]
MSMEKFASRVEPNEIDRKLSKNIAQSERACTELLNKLVNDVRNVNEELAEYTNTPSWNLPNSSYDDDDDKESSIPLKDIIIKYDMPICDDFMTFSNLLFDANDDFFSSDDESFSDEDVPNEIYSNPLFDEEIISIKIDASIISMIDSLVEQFTGELAYNDLIPPRINEADFDLEEDIHFIERLLYDNSFPRPPKAFQANSNTIIDSFPTFPIPVEDSNYLREEIDIFSGPDDSIPPGIESDDFDSEDDDNSTFLPEFESFHVDYLDSGDSIIDVVEGHPGDINKIYDLGICIKVKSTKFLAPLFPVIDDLLPFSSENEDKVFNHGILASKEKSPPSSSHRVFKASKPFHHKSLMISRIVMTLVLAVFVLRSLELHILSSLWEIPYLILLD